MARKPLVLLGALALGSAAIAIGVLRRDTRTADDATRPKGDAQPPDLVPASVAAPPATLELQQPLKPVVAENAAAPENETIAPRRRREVPPGRVVLFEHATHDPSFPGGRWEVDPGLTDAGWVFPSDEASAVDVPTGLQATIFEHENGAGHRVLLGPGLHNLAPYGLNDMASSIRVTRFGQDVDSPVGPDQRVELYEHRPAHGGERGETWPLPLPEGRDVKLFTSSARDLRAGAVSAAWVPLGFELILFEQPDGRGLALVLGPGFHELDLVGFNDRAASARVRRMR